jgi:hypothetical protein
MYACNGEICDGIESPACEKAVREGVDELGPHLVPDWQSDEESGEITEGHRDFSWHGCDACFSKLGGELHRFAVLGEEDDPDSGVENTSDEELTGDGSDVENVHE